MSNLIQNPLLTDPDTDTELDHDLGMNSENWTDDLRCARGLVFHFLGQSYFGLKDYDSALGEFVNCLSCFDSVSNEAVKLRFVNVLQDTYNLAGKVLCQMQNPHL